MNPRSRVHRARNWALAALAATGLTGRGVSSGQEPPQASPTTQAVPVATERTPYDPDQVRKTVAFWQAQSGRDAQGAIALRELAAAYLSLQRETGDIADAVRAEDAARRSLKVLSRGNSGAATRLARALLAQHRFPEALAIATLIASGDPQGSRLVADIQLELGDYDAARKALEAVPAESEDMNYKALRARFEAIDGRPDQALRLMKEARALADERPDMPAEVVAWYGTMVGHMLIDSGQLDEGEKSCHEALKVFPRDYRAMTGLAEAATWRGDHQGAVDWGLKALAISAQNPEALRLVGEGYAAMGKQQEADEQYRRLETLAHSFPRIYDRHWVLFCADNDRHLDEALALARKDLELRHDIHGYDALAWACYKKGLLPEAGRMMEEALARGTQEAPLLQHAATIARALGDRGRADTLLARARVLNPYLVKASEASPAAK